MKWFKAHHGLPLDPRWQGVAAAAKAKPTEVVALALALLDYASQQGERGSIDGFNVGDIAAVYRMRPERIEAILAALCDRGVIVDDRLADWERDQEQPAPDNSTHRVQRWRARRQREAAGTSPEVNPEAVNNVVKLHGNGDETVEPFQCNGDSDSRKEVVFASANTTRAREVLQVANWFEEFWRAQPSRGRYSNPKKPAREKFAAAVKRGVDPVAIISAAANYRIAVAGTDPRYVAQAATWLHQERWSDHERPPERPRPRTRMC